MSARWAGARQPGKAHRPSRRWIQRRSCGAGQPGGRVAVGRPGRRRLEAGGDLGQHRHATRAGSARPGMFSQTQRWVVDVQPHLTRPTPDRRADAGRRGTAPHRHDRLRCAVVARRARTTTNPAGGDVGGQFGVHRPPTGHIGRTLIRAHNGGQPDRQPQPTPPPDPRSAPATSGRVVGAGRRVGVGRGCWRPEPSFGRVANVRAIASVARCPRRRLQHPPRRPSWSASSSGSASQPSVRLRLRRVVVGVPRVLVVGAVVRRVVMICWSVRPS